MAPLSSLLPLRAYGETGAAAAGAIAVRAASATRVEVSMVDLGCEFTKES